MVEVKINSFVRRQTPESQFSHFDYSEGELEKRVFENVANALPGYRPGVVKVAIAPDGAWTAVKTLEAGDELHGDFSPRAAGEKPRKHFYVIGPKLPAVSVEVILYHSTTLAETNDNQFEDCWEIIAFNTSPTDQPSPICPHTLMANHFGLSGGTSTGLTSTAFVVTLEQSIKWWADKILCKPEKKDESTQKDE